MSAVSSTNPGLANLLQTLSNVDSPLLSSPNALSAIENSSPADIVKLSVAATQLQEVSAIFGDSQTTSESLQNGSSTFTDLENALTSASSTSSSSTSNSSIPTSQLADYQSLLQSAQADALLNPGSASSSTGSLFNVLG